MPTEIRMPALSPTMTEGNLAKWHKREGEDVSAGDVIAEIETDKATMEIEAADEGVLGRILVPEGTEGVAVNTPIALLLGEGEDASALEIPAAVPKANGGGAPAEAPPAPAAEAPKPSPAAPAPAKMEGRTFASPLARRMAAQAGLDLAAVAGSGPHGRVVKHDIEAALAGRPPAAAPAPAAGPPAAAAPPPSMVEPPGAQAYSEIPHSAMRKIIARRLVESKREAPHFYLTIDCVIDELMKVRAELNGRSPEGEGAYKLTVNDFVVRAVALALMKVPEANASWTETALRRYHSADVSVAVAVPDGLITPVIRNAERKGLSQISREMRDLAARARDGRLMPEEFQGGSFTVSNLGMFGIRDFAAVINPPQGCILAVGAAEQRPIVRDDALAVATVMTCTLSTDHRVVDGAIGAAFLAEFKKLVEDPLSMLL